MHTLPPVGTVIGHFAAYSLLLLAMKAMPTGEHLLVITDPRGGASLSAGVIGRANGQIVEGTAMPWVTVATSTESGFAWRLVRAGALIVLNFPNSTGCYQRNTRDE